ncbi:MAG TPA: hypothetical protein VGM84_27335 [Steroidobacteraceae bacterium]|jgi:hypothetical protein
MFKRLLDAAIGTRVLFALGISFIAQGAALAQTAIGPWPASPPTYAGTLPLSILGYEQSAYSSGFNFTFTVSTAELQKFLPAGYRPIPTSADGATTQVAAIFGHQVLLTLNTPAGDFAAGTYGPFESFDLGTLCFTPPGSPIQIETVYIARYVDNAEISDIRATLDGHGNTHVASIEVRVNEGNDQVRMKGTVEDPGLGLKISAALTGPAEIGTQLRHGTFLPGVSALGARYVDTTVAPPTTNPLKFFTTSAELTATLSDPASLDVTAQQIRLTGGKMKVLGAVPGNFYFNQENLLKSSPF